MKRFLLYATLTVGAFVFLYPFVWMLAASLKPETEIAGFNPFSSQFHVRELPFRSSARFQFFAGSPTACWFRLL